MLYELNQEDIRAIRLGYLNGIVEDAVNTMKVPGVLKGSIQDIIDNRDRLEENNKKEIMI